MFEFVDKQAKKTSEEKQAKENERRNKRQYCKNI
jgi:hypothetical protein